MNSEMTATMDAGDEKLREARLEIGRLSELLAARELELSDTKIALSRFEGFYYTRLGRKYAELDELLARIAAVQAADSDAWDIRTEQARRAREQAERSAGEYRRRAAEPDHPEPRPKVAEEIKKLYRRIAARIHPDRAVDEESRSIRTRLMAELNDAYAQVRGGRREGRQRGLLLEALGEHDPRIRIQAARYLGELSQTSPWRIGFALRRALWWERNPDVRRVLEEVTEKRS